MVASQHVVPSEQIGIGGGRLFDLAKRRGLLERPQFVQFQRLARHRRKKHKYHHHRAKPDGQSFVGASEMYDGLVKLPGGPGVDNVQYVRMRSITLQKEHRHPDLHQDNVANRFVARVLMTRSNLKWVFTRTLQGYICQDSLLAGLCGKLLHRLNGSS